MIEAANVADENANIDIEALHATDAELRPNDAAGRIKQIERSNNRQSRFIG